MKIVIEVSLDETAYRSRDRRVAGPFGTPPSPQAIADRLAETILTGLEGIPNAVTATVVADGCRVVILPETCTPEPIPAGTLRADAIRQLEDRVRALEGWAARACGDYEFSEHNSIAIRLG